MTMASLVTFGHERTTQVERLHGTVFPLCIQAHTNRSYLVCACLSTNYNCLRSMDAIQCCRPVLYRFLSSCGHKKICRCTYKESMLVYISSTLSSWSPRLALLAKARGEHILWYLMEHRGNSRAESQVMANVLLTRI